VVSTGPSVGTAGNPRAGLRIVQVPSMARSVYALGDPANVRWRLRFTTPADGDAAVQKVQLAAPPGTAVEPTPTLVIVHDSP
jgi:hypothetical protein